MHSGSGCGPSVRGRSTSTSIELFADPSVADALWPGPRHGLRAERRGAAILAEDIRHWQRESFGPWIFFETTNGSFVGRGGLRRTKVLGCDCVELLYVVRPEFWGAGYATEMASIAMARARALSLDEVVGFTATSNRASRRVLEKVGLRFEAIFERAGLPHWLGRWPERDRSSAGEGPR